MSEIRYCCRLKIRFRITYMYFRKIVSRANTPKNPRERKIIVESHPSTGLFLLKISEIA